MGSSENLLYGFGDCLPDYLISLLANGRVDLCESPLREALLSQLLEKNGTSSLRAHCERGESLSAMCALFVQSAEGLGKKQRGRQSWSRACETLEVEDMRRGERAVGQAKEQKAHTR
eukprot:3994914-Pleurochrysis_carterae.AAC.2